MSTDLGVIVSGSDYQFTDTLLTTDGVTGETVEQLWFTLYAAGMVVALEKNLTEDPTEVAIVDDSFTVLLTDAESVGLSGRYYVSIKVRRTDGRLAQVWTRARVQFDASEAQKSKT